MVWVNSKMTLHPNFDQFGNWENGTQVESDIEDLEEISTDWENEQILNQRSQSPEHIELFLEETKVLEHGNENICFVCAKTFKHQIRLDRHIFYEHEVSPESPHGCEICSKYFFDENDLSKHKGDIHSGKKICDQCGETFEILSLFKKHCNEKHSVNPKTCNICDYEASKTDRGCKSLQYHILQKHPDPTRLTCHICYHQCKSLTEVFVHYQVRVLYLLF